MSERGAASAELVICAPVLVLLAVLALAVGRLLLDQAQVVDVARAAVEAASVLPTPAEARSAGVAAASYEIAHDGLPCATTQVSVDTADLVPGGQVGVHVTCVVRLSPASLPGLPEDVTLQATAVAPVEDYREVG